MKKMEKLIEDIQDQSVLSSHLFTTTHFLFGIPYNPNYSHQWWNTDIPNYNPFKWTCKEHDNTYDKIDESDQDKSQFPSVHFFTSYASSSSFSWSLQIS